MFCSVHSNVNYPFAVSLAAEVQLIQLKSDIGNEAPGDPSALGEIKINCSVKVKVQIRGIQDELHELSLMQMQGDS